MKKVLAMILSLALFASVMMVPAAAAVERKPGWYCPKCGTACLYDIGSEKVEETWACDVSFAPHTHILTYSVYHFYCPNCGVVNDNKKVVSNECTLIIIEE